MTAAPALWINGRRIIGGAQDEFSPLAYAEITFGMDSYLDFQDPETLTVQIRVTAPEADSLALGQEIALYQPDAPNDITWFTGRIGSMRATSYRNRYYLVTLTCVSLLSELANRMIVPVMPRENGDARESRLLTLTGWESGRFANHYGYAPASERRAEQPSNLLTVLDENLRTNRRVRRDASYLHQGQNRIIRRMETLDDATRTVGYEHLLPTADGVWITEMISAEYWGAHILELPAARFLADLTYRQDPEDLLTRLQIERWSTTSEKEERITTDISATYDGSEALRVSSGDRLLTISTDLPSDSTDADHRPLSGHYLSAVKGWRPDRLQLQRTEDLPVETLALLISPRYRFGAYAVIRGIGTLRPDDEYSAIRGTVIGGKAAWTGKKWDIEISLGRSSDAPLLDGYWTLDRLAQSSNVHINAATPTTAAGELTIDDFLRIGS